jgi:hypothetical protein
VKRKFAINKPENRCMFPIIRTTKIFPIVSHKNDQIEYYLNLRQPGRTTTTTCQRTNTLKMIRECNLSYSGIVSNGLHTSSATRSCTM